MIVYNQHDRGGYVKTSIYILSLGRDRAQLYGVSCHDRKDRQNANKHPLLLLLLLLLLPENPHRIAALNRDASGCRCEKKKI